MESKQNLITARHSVTALKAHLSLNVRRVDQSVESYQRRWGLNRVKCTDYAKFDVQKKIEAGSSPPLN